MKRIDMLKLMLDIHYNPPESIRGMNDGGQQTIRFFDYMLSKMEEAGMLPPPDHIEPLSMDKNGIVLEITYNQAPNGNFYKGWEDE